MAFVIITDEEIDAKSPIDDLLMKKLRDNQNDLNTRVVAAGNSPFVFEVDGQLNKLRANKRSIAYALINKEFTPSQCRFMLKKSGTSGALQFDLRKHTTPNTPIAGIAHQFSSATSSIAQTGSALSTQSISRTTAQIATQSITHAKGPTAIQSIIGLGGNLWQYNLASSLDSDSLVGDPFVVAGASSGGNNGNFFILEKNRAGGNNVVVTNASGVAQVAAAGTVQPKIMSYNFTNPVDSSFTTGEASLFASHTSAANNGTYIIYAINQSGNNIWVKNLLGVTQGAAAGTTDVQRFSYNFSAPISTTDYIVGESIKAASHSSGGNNGNFPIRAINSGGNNIIVYNAGGTTQGGVAGTVNTNRWTYTLAADPSAQVVAGYNLFLDGHTTAANNGTFVVMEVNRGGGNNIVIYNTAGVTQGGAAGNVYTARKLIQFTSDQSTNYTTDSYIEMADVVSSLYNYAEGRAPFKVLQVNRGGGANFNVVIENAQAPSQASPAGFIQIEMKSIFNNLPSLASSVTSTEANQLIKGQSTDLKTDIIPAQTPIMLYLLTHHNGDPRDLTVSIA